jgi:hypothetical protein
MAAVRLVQTLYEMTSSGAALDAPALLLLQLAMNLIERPAQATQQLLGLETAARFMP